MNANNLACRFRIEDNRSGEWAPSTIANFFSSRWTTAAEAVMLFISTRERISIQQSPGGMYIEISCMGYFGRFPDGKGMIPRYRIVEV